MIDRKTGAIPCLIRNEPEAAEQINAEAGDVQLKQFAISNKYTQMTALQYYLQHHFNTV